jgi:hypothetical protein
MAHRLHASHPQTAARELGDERRSDRGLAAVTNDGVDGMDSRVYCKSIVLNTVVALVGSLRDVDPDGEIRIVVKSKVS